MTLEKLIEEITPIFKSFGWTLKEYSIITEASLYKFQVINDAWMRGMAEFHLSFAFLDKVPSDIIIEHMVIETRDILRTVEEND